MTNTLPCGHTHDEHENLGLMVGKPMDEHSGIVLFWWRKNPYAGRITIPVKAS